MLFITKVTYWGQFALRIKNNYKKKLFARALNHYESFHNRHNNISLKE
jgi:hypothetical protein